ncbi:MAG: PP2C family protein-serine/threonine phosphatase [Acidimicrobiia bacterium]|nr:PP2C family protein-serine/threonine phosphatase [Acidimicrobiia bacterium]
MKAAVLIGLGLICVVAAIGWARSARYRRRFLANVEHDPDNAQQDAAWQLAQSAFRKEVHSALLYSILAVASFATAVSDDNRVPMVFALAGIPAAVSVAWSRGAVREARLSRQRFFLERRAEEALQQEDFAPKAWAARLAPDSLPDVTGFEVGRVYEAGSGLMAGDFFDVYRVGDKRLAAVIGDVAGHGIESSITAFQAKYLLRVFLRQFRDPAQALEELNRQMAEMDRGEEFISMIVVVFDTEAGTIRYASAGHPAGWLWHAREVQPLRATGPLLMLDPGAAYFSKEIPLAPDDFVLLYTDGLAEARNGDELFGEERVAMAIRRDPGAAPEVLTKGLLEEARDFANGMIEDDVAILAVRRS